jgi:hypothetical protein
MQYFEVMNKLRFDKEANTYSITEAGFKYEFPHSLHKDFKNYIFLYHLVSRWYKQLNDEDRDKVYRFSAYQ